MPLVSVRKPREGNLIKAETMREHGFCREIGTVAATAGTELEIGTVLGFAGGNYVVRNPAGNDGSEVTAGILLENVTVPASGEIKAAVFARGPAVVARDALIYVIAHNPAQRATVEQELEAAQILVREQV